MKAIVYAFDEVDRPEEVAKALTDLRQEMVNEVEALRTELAGCVRQKPKKPKKGFAMKKLLSVIVVFVIAFCSLANAQFVKTDINYDIASNPESLSQWLRDVVASGTFEYTPIAAPTGNDIIEGKVYYDSSSNALFVSTDGATWTQLDTAGGTSLDASYNLGNTIDVDGSAVTMTVSDTDNNAALLVVQNDSTNDPDAMNITSAADAGTAVGLQIDCTAGFDIQGTGDTWNVTLAGVAALVGVTVGTSDLTFSENGAIILNDTDGEIQFADASEDISFGFGTANTLILSSDTGVTDVDFAALTTLKGLTTITGDAADFTISITADAGGEDLLITQDGVVDGSVHIVGAGTGADAISLITSAGGIDITVVGAAAGEDLDLDTNSSLNLGSSEAAVDDAIVIETTGAGSGMRIISLADIDITTTGAAGEDITLDNQGGSLHFISTEAVTDGMNFDATGGIDIDTGDDFAVTVAGAAGQDILMTNTGGSYILSATEDIEDAITLNSTTGGINITADGAAASDLDLTCTNGSVHIIGGEAIADAITAVSTGGVDITSAATFDIDITATGGRILAVATEAVADQFKIDAQGIVAGDAINLETTNGGIMLNADDSSNGDIELNAEDDVIITTAGDITVTNTGDATFTGTWLPATIVKKTITTGAVTTADSGYVLQVSADAQTITLPATVAGVEFTIMCIAADGGALLTVELDNNDKFIGSGFTPANGEAMTIPKATQNRGDYFKVSAHVDGWIITEMVGTWAEATP